jgi:hypothetical protein
MSHSNRKNGYRFFRKPRTQNTRLMEYYAVVEIGESGYTVPNRLSGRANLSGQIPTTYDDLNYSNPRHLVQR